VPGYGCDWLAGWLMLDANAIVVPVIVLTTARKQDNSTGHGTGTPHLLTTAVLVVL
jgi:hypothetical protein